MLAVTSTKSYVSTVGADCANEIARGATAAKEGVVLAARAAGMRLKATRTTELRRGIWSPCVLQSKISGGRRNCEWRNASPRRDAYEFSSSPVEASALPTTKEFFQRLYVRLGLFHVTPRVLGILVLQGGLRLIHIGRHAVFGGGDITPQIEALLCLLLSEVVHTVFDGPRPSGKLVHLRFEVLELSLPGRFGLRTLAAGSLRRRRLRVRRLWGRRLGLRRILGGSLLVLIASLRCPLG